MKKFFILFCFFLLSFSSYSQQIDEGSEGFVWGLSLGKGYGYAGYPQQNANVGNFSLKLGYQRPVDKGLDFSLIFYSASFKLKNDTNMSSAIFALEMISKPLKDNYSRFQPFYGGRIGYGSVDYIGTDADETDGGLTLSPVIGFEYFILPKISLTVTGSTDIYIGSAAVSGHAMVGFLWYYF